MTVRQGLLAILDEGACYGYQLRAEHARRTGSAPLNVGQIYTTLERLERDGLVARRGADERGHVYWGITDAGSTAASDWWASAEPRSARDDLVQKLALAATLPKADAAAIVTAQRAAAEQRLADLDESHVGSGGDVSSRIALAASRAHARADLEWLDAVADELAGDAASRVFGLTQERPRRGRPVRSTV